MVSMALSCSLSAFMATQAPGETLCSLLDLSQSEMPHPTSPYSQLQHLGHLSVQASPLLAKSSPCPRSYSPRKLQLVLESQLPLGL